MSPPASPLPVLYRPAQIADVLGCSEWWVKEQARRRRIPFTRLGGSYRFTADHLAEIIRIFEERPLAPPDVGTLPSARSPYRPVRAAPVAAEAPPASDNKPAAPSTGTAFAPRFRFGVHFAFDIVILPIWILWVGNPIISTLAL